MGAYLGGRHIGGGVESNRWVDGKRGHGSSR